MRCASHGQKRFDLSQVDGNTGNVRQGNDGMARNIDTLKTNCIIMCSLVDNGRMHGSRITRVFYATMKIDNEFFWYYDQKRRRDETCSRADHA